ncbi:MAG: hypothetical protein JKY45_09005, partial [Emcibacter sp.]|nr:hypothetical protein [Emcibacter sp.]
MTSNLNTKKTEASNSKGPARDLIDTLENRVQKGIILSVSDAAQMIEAEKTGKIGSFNAKSPYASCLIPLLNALGWRGSIRGLFEALPHFADSLDLTEFRSTLAHLQYKTVQTTAQISQIDERLFPCLFAGWQNHPIIILSKEEGRVRIFDSADRTEKFLEDTSVTGKAYFISSEYTTQTNKKKQTKPQENWVS